jgi:hypothetical protein
MKLKKKLIKKNQKNKPSQSGSTYQARNLSHEIRITLNKKNTKLN